MKSNALKATRFAQVKLLCCYSLKPKRKGYLTYTTRWSKADVLPPTVPRNEPDCVLCNLHALFAGGRDRSCGCKTADADRKFRHPHVPCAVNSSTSPSRRENKYFNGGTVHYPGASITGETIPRFAEFVPKCHHDFSAPRLRDIVLRPISITKLVHYWHSAAHRTVISRNAAGMCVNSFIHLFHVRLEPRGYKSSYTMKSYDTNEKYKSSSNVAWTNKLSRAQPIRHAGASLGIFLSRDAIHKRVLCRHAVSVCPSVCPSGCLSRSCILSKRINIIFNFFSPSRSHIILDFTIPNVMAIFRREPR